MPVDVITQTSGNGTNRRYFGSRLVDEGLEIWKKHKDESRTQRLKEQHEDRVRLEKYWPFEQANNRAKPRGLRNLRLEGLFPDKDFRDAKRFVGTLDLGRPGGGAPLVTDTGKKVTRTREDPLLRFQFGSHDLRKCVDNTMRYKTNRRVQEEYKKDLDRMVEEKRKAKEQERMEEKQFYQKQVGWTDEKDLKDLAKSPVKKPTNNIFYPCKNVNVGSRLRRKLSPLPNGGRENGVELVPILAKQRRSPKINLDTTDVTNQNKIQQVASSIWNRQGSAYLRDLTQQMSLKQLQIKEMKDRENAIIQKHFSTWDGFWGRPGNGAPIRSSIRKQRLDKLQLYPQMVPIGVH